jgi:hypothetical protein
MDPTIDEAYRLAQGEEPDDFVEREHQKTLREIEQTQEVNHIVAQSLRKYNNLLKSQAHTLAQRQLELQQQQQLTLLYQIGFAFVFLVCVWPL